MIEHTYRVLGYYKFLDILSHYAVRPTGESYCLTLKPLNDPEQNENELKLVSEMRLLLKTQGFVSLPHVTDVIPMVEKTGALDLCLEPDESLCIFPRTLSRKSVDFF